MPETSPDHPPRPAARVRRPAGPVRGPIPGLVLVLAGSLAACAGPGSDTARLSGETDVACIHRLYDYPNRAVPFQVAASECAGNRTVDLSGDRYYQVLASSLNVRFVSHDRPGTDTIALTGSRIPQSTSEPAPPQLFLH